MDGQNDYPKEQDDYPMDRGEWQPEPDYGSSDYGRNNYGDDGLDCYDDNYNPYCPCSSDDYKCDLPRCQCSPDDECYRPPRCQCSPDDECYRPPRCQCSPDDEYDRPPRCQCSPEDDKCPKCPTCPKCKNCKGRFRSGLFPDACFKQVADGGNDDSFAVSPEECHEVCDMMNGPRESDFSWVDCDEVCDESLPYPLSLNAIASARGGHGSAASNPFFGGGQSSSSRYGDYRNPSYDYRWGDDRNGGSSYDHRWGDDCNGGRCYGYEKHESSSYEYPPSGSPSYGDQGYGDDQYDSNRGGWEPPYPPQKNKGKWVFVLNGFRPQKYQDNYPQGGGGYGKGKGGYH